MIEQGTNLYAWRLGAWIAVVFSFVSLCGCGSSNDESLVHVYDIDPSIRTDLKYTTTHNITKNILPGYDGSMAMVTYNTAQKLKAAQAIARRFGMSLIIYDAYHSPDTEKNLKAWLKKPIDYDMRHFHYPRLDKQHLIGLDYMKIPSDYAQGTTVDVTLIPLRGEYHLPQVQGRRFTNGIPYSYLADGTVDMGTHYAFYDYASSFGSPLVSPAHNHNRSFLKFIMESVGFRSHPGLWWRYTYTKRPT